MKRRSALSTEPLQYAVTALAAGAPTDPTTWPVAFAFLPPGVRPTSGDWKSGTWETWTATTPTTYAATITVGPTGNPALTVGRYEVWIRVTAPTGAFTETAGQLVIT